MLPIVLISKSKRSSASAISKLLAEKNVSKSNVTTIEKDGTTLKLEDIAGLNKLISYIYSMPHAVIIYDFETARAEFQNALLKILEEAQNNLLFLLISSTESRLLETIKSRVKIQRLPIVKKEIGVLDMKMFFKNTFPMTDKITKEKALLCIDTLIIQLQSTLKDAVYVQNWTLAQNICTFLKECVDCRNLLVTNNLNAQMTIDHLAIGTMSLIG